MPTSPMAEIVKAVAKAFYLTPRMIRSRSMSEKAMRARRLAAYYGLRRSGLSRWDVGRGLDRHSDQVVKMADVVDQELGDDTDVHRDVVIIEKILNHGPSTREELQ